MTTKAEAALIYASWGWHVLPVVPGGKIPATQHGVNDATTNPEQITKWWAQNPEANIGIAAGAKSGIVVFDIDPRNGGDASWIDWTREHGCVPEGAMQMTAGGGEHHIAQYTEEIRSCKLREGIDLLADGRYFVAYPSTIEGRRYEWEASSDPFDAVGPFEIPSRWLEAYRQLRKPTERPVAAGGLIQGSRNNGLTALGGAMRRYGMTEAEIFAALSIANETRCEIPLPSSELAQIVRSVARYEPESDVAASAAIGSDAADAILSAVKAGTQEYYFTRATSFLDQPAPLKWVIKGWLAQGSVAMVFGDSGSGKTFFTLDMACRIAAGMDWHGKRTVHGVVVYMAGEGNYGLRQRVAAWCKAHKISKLDNLLISNKGIDMDAPEAPAQIINAVRELTTEDVTCVFVDTLNNHQSGDENSPSDTRKMINGGAIACAALANATLVFNHHIGVAAEAKTRGRGSSAWRASMDTQILIAKKDGLIEVSCTKMKDAEEPEPFCGRLEPVDLGWLDEDGIEIKGAVFQMVDDVPEKKQKKESEYAKDIRKFTNAWWTSGAEDKSDSPYLSKEGLTSYLINNEGFTQSTASTYMKPGRKGSLIYNLLNAEIIRVDFQGWVVIDPVLASTMLIRRQER